MNKQFGAAFLLAGTAIGSGMISLPMVLAKFGIIGTCAIMIMFAVLTYLTAIIRSDLNLCSHAAASLKEVGEKFDCRFAGNLGDFMLKLLSFALMSAYISGGSSIIGSFIDHSMSQLAVVFAFSAIIALIFAFAPETIVNLNKILFIAMFSTLIVLIAVLFIQTPISVIPQQADNVALSEWTTLVPVIFTSFGFQGSIHSMTKFAKNDRTIVQHACIWGSIIPAIVYILWTAAILLVVANTDATFFQLMLAGKASDVGELIRVLSNAAANSSIQIIVWMVSGLAILTSIIGVGLALIEIFQREFRVSKKISIAIAVFLPAVIAIAVPNAFIRILNVSGIILAVIAIISPVLISGKILRHQKIQKQRTAQKTNEMADTKEKMLSNTLLLNKHPTITMIAIWTVFACGMAIIALGIIDLLR